MASVSIIHDDGSGSAVDVPDEFAAVIEWLVKERDYQVQKWGYDDQDQAHALEGLGEDSWFWQRAVLNYTGRVRLFGVTGPAAHQGVQALLKIVSSLAAQAEHLLRSGQSVDRLPKPGLSSGNHE